MPKVNSPPIGCDVAPEVGNQNPPRKKTEQGKPKEISSDFSTVFSSHVVARFGNGFIGGAGGGFFFFLF